MNDDRPLDFVRQIVADDVASGKHDGRVLTRFPPEPNGFPHIGHAAAISLNFGVAAEHAGRTTLRMDDTNPTTEDMAFVEAIARDIRWLGFEWDGEIRYASDYFEALYKLAIRMIEDGFAYVDSLSEEEIREYRGTVTEAGRPSPYRNRSIEENLDLFRRMREGEFEDGTHVLRARIDMAASNMKLRDPLMYRIRHAHHYRTGDEWPIYPMYDWAHGQSDAIEGITHSLCSLEFENHRPLYDWFIEHTRPAAAEIDQIPGALGGGTDELGSWSPRPRQYEFARLNLDYTVVSKRRLKPLVENGLVDGWDDPRMSTIAGFRRRGVPPEAIATFIDQVGIAKADKRVDLGTLEYAIRDALNRTAPRVMAVLDPLRVVIENFGTEGGVGANGEDADRGGSNGNVEDGDGLARDAVIELDAPYFPRDVEEPPADWPATRIVPFTRELLIERADFSEDPPKGFRRMAPGREIRLRHGFFVTCTGVEKDDEGEITAIRCTYDPATRGGAAPDGRKVTGTIHWVSATEALPCEVRAYDRLFTTEDPAEGVDDLSENFNHDSLEVFAGARVEPSVAGNPADTRYQFERQGYFVRDTSSPEDALVFNRTVSLRDTWASMTTGRPALDDEPAKKRERSEKPEAGPVGEDTGYLERESARASTPTLAAGYARLTDEVGLPTDLADLLTGDPSDLALFDETLASAGADHARAVANWLVQDVRGVTADGDTGALTPEALGRLVELVETDHVSRSVGRELLARLVAEGGDPKAIVEAEGLGQIGDRDAVAALVEQALAANPDEVERYRGGQTGLAGFFVGQVMRASGGRADAALVNELVAEQLG